MNIDLLPFPAFALESWGPAPLARGDGKTLTLQLALPAVQFGEPMSGSATANQVLVGCPSVLRAAVVPGDGQALTITFSAAAIPPA